MPIHTPLAHPVNDHITLDVLNLKDDAAILPSASFCSLCHSPLTPIASAATLPAALCLSCTDARTVSIKPHELPVVIDEEDDDYEDDFDAASILNRRSGLQSHRPIPIRSSPLLATKLRSFSDVSDASSRPSLFSPTESFFSSPPSSPFYDEHRGRSPSFSSRRRAESPATSSSGASSSSSGPISFDAPDPYRDITRLRLGSRGNHVLYPGASFSGTQKSGRNNYEVTVTVLDVDFNTSQLSGYLRINGLTDDWPELTTYFDAEIIGERFGFLTSQSEFGASETEDMTHWGRFPAFRMLKGDMRRPSLTISERHREKRGVVFMRWKERFLVPDWKVKDINGASFAGFYYVCVEYNPGKAPTISAPSFSDDDDFPSLGSPVSPTKHRSTGPATMTGFYYHADSEPYQQLSLTHVPEKAAPTYEFC